MRVCLLSTNTNIYLNNVLLQYIGLHKCKQFCIVYVNLHTYMCMLIVN